MHASPPRCLLLLAAAASLVIPATQAAPVIDGSINSGEGWTLFTENPDARPYLGGSTTQSDDFDETSQYHWWDGSDHGFSSGKRGGLNNIYWAADASHLYLGLWAGTAPFNNWNDSGGGNGDQGNLYVAIDTAPAFGSQLNANDGHSTYGGIKAVDFLGWQPKYVLGVLYYDNGGGGGGAANIEQTITHTVTGGSPQNTPGSLLWNATSVGGGLAHYEFQIAWSLLGFASMPFGQEFRLAAFMTQNGERWDAYDSAPGIGNNGPYEQIGDNPGDRDDGGQWGATDVMGSNVPFGSFPGSQQVNPGAQYGGAVTNDFNAVGHNDEIDTIQEFYQFTVVPEPSASALLVMGGLAVVALKMLRRRAVRQVPNIPGRPRPGL